MCTAISVLAGKEHYFGRNLDFEYGFGEKIIITPRNFPFSFRNGEVRKKHFAIIGVGILKNGYPLYFDAVNEKGLAIAGLRFPGNCMYFPPKAGKENVASFELIPWVLSQCETVLEVKEKLKNLSITNEAFLKTLPPSPLHFIIADKTQTITVEQTKEGLFIFDNPTGVLTNNPPFPMQMFSLNNYLSLTPKEPENLFSERLFLAPYSRGMGAIGLPGDLSSGSRFVKTCFLTQNAVWDEENAKNVHQFLHILYSVYQIKGAVEVKSAFEITHYTTCVNTKSGIYYYTTYGNSTVNAVDLFLEDLEEASLIIYDFIISQNIQIQNKKEL